MDLHPGSRTVLGLIEDAAPLDTLTPAQNRENSARAGVLTSGSNDATGRALTGGRSVPASGRGCRAAPGPAPAVGSAPDRG